MVRPTDEQSPPPATAVRRRRWMVAGFVAAAVGLVVWQVLPDSGRGAYSPASGSPVSGTFEVPTYDWDGGSAMEARVGGTLWFTTEGCTLVSNGEGADRVTGAVFFPNATGVTYDNGVRAVVDGNGRVFAVEGQEFAYSGGYVVEPDSDLGQEWLAQCPDTDLREGAVVNDEPDRPPLTEAAPAPDEPGPTAPTSDEELGYYKVPTFEWDPADGGEEALIEGPVTFTDEGCPIIESQADDQPVVTGLIFPNAEGYRNPHDEDVPMIYSSFPNGTSGMMAMEGEMLSYGGGGGPADDERWTSVCGESSIDAVFYVQDAPFPLG